MHVRRATWVLASHVLFACGQYQMPRSGEWEGQIAFDKAPETPAVMATEAPAASEEAVPRRRELAPNQVPVPSQRKVIRHGNLNLEVKSVEEVLAVVKARVESLNGYISNESVSEDSYARKIGSLSCRIPSEKLDEAMQQIKALGKVESLSVAADDITDQYYDLEIRIDNQKKLETRLLSLLERQTNKLSDLLEIEREVARVRTEIDSMEGRKRLWDNQVDYSTLAVYLREPIPTIAGEGGGALRTLVRSFGQAGNNFVLTVAGIIAASGAVVPVGVVLGFVAWLLVRIARKRRSGRSGKTDGQVTKDEDNRSEK